MTVEPPPIIAVRGLAFAYGDAPALRGIDLSLRAGETLALLGPNGAGKSSLLRLIAGRLKPVSGEVRVAGGDPGADPAARRAVGWVPQEIGLYPGLTVAENLDIFARLAGLGRAERKRTLATLLERTETAEVAHRLVGTLSGGYQRRVNIAASLVAEPRLILLDEPTQGVDLEAREAIHALLLSLRAAGAALLLSTHDFAEAERLADRVAILRDGRILRDGPLHALLRPFADAPPEQEARLAAPPDDLAEAVLRRRGFVPLPESLVWRATPDIADGLEGAALLAAFRAEGVAVAEIRLRRPGLETLYRDALAPARVPPSPARRRPAEALP